MDFLSINHVTLYLPIILLLISTIIIWFYKKSFKYWEKIGIEYLKPKIPFGNALDLMTQKVTLGELFAQQYLKIKEKGLKHAGTYICWKPVYIPVDPTIIKHILISDFEYFPNHAMYMNETGDPLSAHLFNLESENWRNLRAKFPAAFTSAKMKKMFVIMEKMTEQLTINLDEFASKGEPLNIKHEISKFTTDIITSCAFGIETNTMKSENQELLKQGRSFFDDQWNIYNNILTILAPRSFLLKINFRVMTREFEKYFKDFFQKLMNYRKENKIQSDDLANILLRLTEKHEDERDFTGKRIMEPLNFQEFTAQAVVFFAAGFETSSSTQTFALYELAKNPACQSKLRKEINEILAKYDHNLTYEAVMEMKYLETIVDETLRLYPVFPILTRVCTKEYQIPGTDVILEKNSVVIISNMGIHRDPEYYPNPDKFDPDRFSMENKTNRPSVSYLPFGDGPRICVGKRFGLLQTKIGIISMIRNYEISLDKKTSDSFKFAPDEFILRKTGDVWVKLKKIPEV